MRAKILNASAGSGKTYQLAYKYVRDVIDQPGLYRHILAVTFTNKATEEMKSRILKEIHRLASGGASPYLGNLCRELSLDERSVRKRAAEVRSKILHDYSRFTVLTIDTFFQRILRAFIKELGIDLNYNVEIETASVLSKGADTLIEQITVDRDLQRWLTEFVQERIDEGRKWDIRDGILSLGGELFKEKNKDALSVPRSREELGRIVSRAAAQAEATKKQLQQTAARAVAIISRAGLTAADFSGKSRSFANYFFTVAAGELKPYGATVAKMAAAPEGWGAKGSPAQALAPELQPLLREMCDIYDANRKSWNTCDLLKENYRSFALLSDLYKRVQQLCDEQNMMLLSETKYVLSEFIGHNDAPFIYEKVGNRFERFMIDEFQDTSLKEWENFLPLLQNAMAQSEETSVLIVGDIKQSIYGFRQSDPALFLSETERYKAGQGGSLITLNRNFRSLENVLYCTNRVFESCMKKETAGMDYDADAMLYPGRSGEGMGGGAPTILQLVDRKAEPDPETGLEYENAKGEAVAAARLVRRLLGTPVSDGKGGTRPARYADIVVLRRSVAGVLPQYLEAFGKLGIPVYSSKGGSFYRTQEILQALDMLWAVHNPLEDVHLLGALHGAGGFSAQEIARIRLCGREKGAQDGSGEGRRLWTCLIDYKNDPDDEALGARVSEFVDLVVRLRRISRQESVATLCGVMLEETGMMEACAAMPRGQIRLANLRSLPVRAAEYDASGLRLGDFLRRIKDTGERNREEDVPVFSDKDDVVRIMTVHQSKGLQFPIVIGTGLGTRFKLGNAKSEDGVLTSRLWCDKDGGFALEYYDPEKAAVDNTLLTRAIAAQRRRDSIAEEMRILYVLMTRAQDRLALVGEISDLKGKELKIWQHDGDEPARMLDWIMPALRDHPDGKKLIWGDLWDFLELQERPDASRWEISASMDAQDAQQEGAHEQEQPDAQREEVLPDEKLMAQLRYRYPYPESAVQRKQSVTDLAHGAEQSFFIKESPAFLTKDKKLRGAQRGSAIHRFMQIADFSAFAAAQDRRAELEKQANAAAQSLRMTREQADAVMDGAALSGQRNRAGDPFRLPRAARKAL